MSELAARTHHLTATGGWSSFSPMSAIVVITTAGTEEQANELARELVGRRHAACVNIIPGIRSVYRWQGKICQDGELMLVIKTTDEEFDNVVRTIQELHHYDVPEILAFRVSRGERRFLDWIESSLDKEADFSDEVDAPAFEDDDEVPEAEET